MLQLKSQREILLMREAGQVVAAAHQRAAQLMQPGVTTREIDAVVESVFIEHGAQPLFKGFPGKTPFPASTCISINEQVVHGIPGDTVLRPGDLVSLDTGCRLNGWCGDSAWTYSVGAVDEEGQRLLDVGRELLRTAVEAMRTEPRWSGVARRMMKVAREAGFSLVDQFVGHGIGRNMHEPPQAPNTLSKKAPVDDFDLQPGLVLAVEPMLNAGGAAVKVLGDHWTAVTKDGKRSVHFEHTIALTTDGPQLLTEGVGTPLFGGAG